MDTLDEEGFEQTRVHLAVVFSLPLDSVQKLKKGIVDALANMPEIRVSYQRTSVGKLRIMGEGRPPVVEQGVPDLPRDEQEGQP
jgi:hypothetical protein